MITLDPSDPHAAARPAPADLAAEPRIGDVVCLERDGRVMIVTVVEVCCDGSVDIAVAYCPGPAPGVQTATARQWRDALSGRDGDGRHTVTVLRRGAP